MPAHTRRTAAFRRIACAFALALGCARADWKPIGPYGGDLWGLLASGPNVFALGSSAIWRSTDGGTSWSATLMDVPLIDLAASGSRLFIAGEGILQSVDGGNSWQKLAIQVPQQPLPAMQPCQTLLAHGRFLIGGATAGIFRSSDGGTTWARVDGYDDLALDEPLQAFDLAGQGKYVYASTSEGLLASSDSGAAGTWRIVAKGPDGYVGNVAALGRYVFVSGDFGVLRSANQGTAWDTLSRNPNPGIKALGALLYKWERNPGPFDTASDFSLARSRDSGATWTQVMRGIRVLDVAAKGDTLFVSREGEGLLRSTDGGSSFAPCPVAATTAVTLGSTGNRILAFGDEAQGDYTTTDKGGTWSRSVSASGGIGFTSLALRGALGFASSYEHRLFLSRDSGKSWSRQPLPSGFPGVDSLTAKVQTVAIHGNVLFLAIRDGIYRSADTGKTWTQVKDPKPAGQTALQGVVFLSDGTDLFLSEKDGFFRSPDSGRHWTPAETPPGGTVRGIARLGGDFYAEGWSGVYRSHDRGDTWSRVNGEVIRFRFLAGVGEALLAAGDAPGLSLSRDGGVSWSAFDQGFNGPVRVSALLVDDTYAYAAIFGAGIWRRPVDEFAGAVRLRPRAAEAGNGPRWARNASGAAVAFDLERPGWARLEAFDLRGHRIAVLMEGAMAAGPHTAAWPSGIAKSGVKVLRLSAGGRVTTRKLALSE